MFILLNLISLPYCSLQAKAPLRGEGFTEDWVLGTLELLASAASPFAPTFAPAPPATSFAPTPPATAFAPAPPATTFAPTPPATTFALAPPATAFAVISLPYCSLQAKAPLRGEGFYRGLGTGHT